LQASLSPATTALASFSKISLCDMFSRHGVIGKNNYK
jgi:hypothetical protein